MTTQSSDNDLDSECDTDSDSGWDVLAIDENSYIPYRDNRYLPKNSNVRFNDYSHYTCAICNISEIKKIEVDKIEKNILLFLPEIDSEGRKHYHNYNEGMVYITCIKGHISHVPYKFTCEYGCHLKK